MIKLDVEELTVFATVGYLRCGLVFVPSHKVTGGTSKND